MEPEKIIDGLKERLGSESLDSFEICFIGNDRLTVEARDGAVESFVRTSEQGLAIRAVKDHRMGIASSAELSSDAVDRLISDVIASVAEVSPSEESVIPSKEKGRKISSSLNEKKGRPLEKIPESEKMALALELEREAKATDSRITRVRQPLYEELTRSVSIYNSNGINLKASRGIASCEVRAIAEGAKTSESGWDFGFSPRFEDLDVKKIARNASVRALSLLGSASIPTGRYNVVFESRASSNLVRLIAQSFFANNVQRRKSPLVGKKGAKYYSPRVTLIDNGLLPDGYGSFPFDDEGVGRRENFLIKDGVITEWLYDTSRAAREGRFSSGNSSRLSIHHPPSINVSNCHLNAGDMSYDEILSAADKGFLITDVMGVHTANVVTGDFSLGAEGFLLEGGKNVRPVRGVLVAGNVHDLFRRVAGMANDVKFLANYGAPSILVPDVQISGDG